MSGVQEKARALIDDSPYKVLVNGPDGSLDLLASLVATFENTKSHADSGALGLVRRWDVAEGVALPVEDEPEYLVTMKRRNGHVEVSLAPPDVGFHDSRPQLCLSLMVDAGLPTALITSSNYSGSVKQIVQALPFDSLGVRLSDEGGLPESMTLIDPSGRHLMNQALPDIGSVTYALRQLGELERQRGSGLSESA